jgi:polyphosphate kinase 2 (PPK2 family)
MLSSIRTDITNKQYNKAWYDMKNSQTDIPDWKIEEYKMTETDILIYEFKKLIIHTALERESRNLWIDWFDTSCKTKNSEKITSASTVYDNNIVSRESLSVPTKNEIRMTITKLYEKYFPWEWKTVVFDRTWNNRALVQNIYRYCSEWQYKNFMKRLESELDRFSKKWYKLQNFFFFISKEVQEERLNKRKWDPLRMHRFSESDGKALEKYDQIKREIWRLAKIYDKAWIPFTLINTENEELWLINLLKAILYDLDYRKKSKEIDFTPDKNIVIAWVDEILKYTRQTNKPA